MFLNILIVIILVFVCINLYTDIKNFLNTGRSFIENMTSNGDVKVSSSIYDLFKYQSNSYVESQEIIPDGIRIKSFTKDKLVHGNEFYIFNNPLYNKTKGEGTLTGNMIKGKTYELAFDITTDVDITNLNLSIYYYYGDKSYSRGLHSAAIVIPSIKSGIKQSFTYLLKLPDDAKETDMTNNINFRFANFPDGLTFDLTNIALNIYIPTVPTVPKPTEKPVVPTAPKPTAKPVVPSVPVIAHHTHENTLPTINVHEGVIKQFTNSINDMFYHYFKYKSEFNDNANTFRPFSKNDLGDYLPFDASKTINP